MKKTMVKKAMLFVLAAILVLGLGACRQEDPPQADPPAAADDANQEADTDDTDVGNDDAGVDEDTGADEGADTTDEVATPGEVVPFNFVIPGDRPQDADAVLEIINQRLYEDGVGIELILTYIPWDAWDHRLNLMLSTGEDFDMFHVMNDRVSLSNYAARGALLDISAYMERYGENIRRHVPEMAMRAGQVDGAQYAIPAFWLESALAPEITLRSDLLDQFGLDVPTNFDELTDAFVYVMENWEKPHPPFVPIIGAGTSTFDVDWKSYDNWPFHVYDNIFYVNQDGTIANWFETDAFRQDAENARRWFELGLIDPDVLMVTNDLLGNQLNAGHWFVHFGTIGNVEPLRTEFPDITVDDFIWLDMDPSQPRVRPYGARNMNAVPLSSENPSSAVKFINWLYASQDNYDLFLYGREGIDFNAIPPQNREDIIQPGIDAPLWSFADWMIGNLDFIRTGTAAPTITNEALFQRNDDAVDGIASMFIFDASDVQTQMVDVQTIISTVISPIAVGVLDYDTHIDAALQQLRDAGIDDLIDEFRRQFEASR